MSNLYCIIGKSGSGKTSIVDVLEMRYTYKVLPSYTTRVPRKEEDKDHTYVKLDEYFKIPNKVCKTLFDGNYYCATSEQIEESDLYVIDLAGYVKLMNNYKGEKKIVPIFIDCSMETCLERMLLRGDTEDKAWERLKNDYYMFRNWKKYIQNGKVINGEKGLGDVIIDIKRCINADEFEEKFGGE